MGELRAGLATSPSDGIDADSLLSSASAATEAGVQNQAAAVFEMPLRTFGTKLERYGIEATECETDAC